MQYSKLYQKSSYLTALDLLEEYLISNNKEDNLDLKKIFPRVLTIMKK